MTCYGISSFRIEWTFVITKLVFLSYDIISESLLNLSKKKKLHCYNDVITIAWMYVIVGVIKFMNRYKEILFILAIFCTQRNYLITFHHSRKLLTNQNFVGNSLPNEYLIRSPIIWKDECWNLSKRTPSGTISTITV